MCWGTPPPRHICWSYYYEPRCFRELPSNLAMFCVPGVMILAIIRESISWCYLASRYSIPVFLNPRFTLLIHVIVFASSFWILVTFAIVLEVRGISFFQIPWTTYGRSSSLNRTITTRVFLMSSSFLTVTLSVQPFCMGYPEETCWTWFDILIYASTTQQVICSSSCPSLVVFWPPSLNW